MRNEVRSPQTSGSNRAMIGLKTAVAAVLLQALVLFLDTKITDTPDHALVCRRHLWYCREGAFVAWGCALVLGGVGGHRYSPVHWLKLRALDNARHHNFTMIGSKTWQFYTVAAMVLIYLGVEWAAWNFELVGEGLGDGFLWEIFMSFVLAVLYTAGFCLWLSHNLLSAQGLMVSLFTGYAGVILWAREHPSETKNDDHFAGEFTYLALAEAGRLWLVVLSPAALLVLYPEWGKGASRFHDARKNWWSGRTEMWLKWKRHHKGNFFSFLRSFLWKVIQLCGLVFFGLATGGVFFFADMNDNVKAWAIRPTNNLIGESFTCLDWLQCQTESMDSSNSDDCTNHQNAANDSWADKNGDHCTKYRAIPVEGFAKCGPKPSRTKANGITKMAWYEEAEELAVLTKSKTVSANDACCDCGGGNRGSGWIEYLSSNDEQVKETRKHLIEHMYEQAKTDVQQWATGQVTREMQKAIWYAVGLASLTAFYNFLSNDPQKSPELFKKRVNFSLNIVQGRVLKMRTVHECGFRELFPGSQTADLFNEWSELALLRQRVREEKQVLKDDAESDDTAADAWVHRVEAQLGSPFILVPRDMYKPLTDQLINRLSMLFGKAYFTWDMAGETAVTQQEYMFALTYEKEEGTDVNGISAPAANQKYRLLLMRMSEFDKFFGHLENRHLGVGSQRRGASGLGRTSSAAAQEQADDGAGALPGASSASAPAIDPSSMKVAELKKELTTRGLDTSGKKADLLARLTADLAAAPATGAAAKELQDADEVNSLRWEGCAIFNAKCDEHGRGRCNDCNPHRCMPAKDRKNPKKHECKMACYGSERIFNLRLLREELEADRKTREKKRIEDVRDRLAKKDGPASPHDQSTRALMQRSSTPPQVAKDNLERRWQRNMYNHKDKKVTTFNISNCKDRTREKGGPRKNAKLEGREDTAAEKARLQDWTRTWLNDEIPLCGTFFVASNITDTSEVGAAIERTMSAA